MIEETKEEVSLDKFLQIQASVKSPNKTMANATADFEEQYSEFRSFREESKKSEEYKEPAGPLLLKLIA